MFIVRTPVIPASVINYQVKSSVIKGKRRVPFLFSCVLTNKSFLLNNKILPKYVEY